MNRRNFVSQSIMGVAGFNLVNTSLSNLLDDSSDVIHWYHQFLNLTDLSKSLWVTSKNDLLDTVLFETSKPLSGLGYSQFGHPVFYHHDTCCMVPYLLEKKQLKEITISFLCKNKDNTWSLLTQVNGFELECLVKAGQDFVVKKEIPSEYILPIKKTYLSSPDKFFSSKGAVQLRTIISDACITSNIKVASTDSLYYYNTFLSGHCLTAAE